MQCSKILSGRTFAAKTVRRLLPAAAVVLGLAAFAAQSAGASTALYLSDGNGVVPQGDPVRLTSTEHLRAYFPTVNSEINCTGSGYLEGEMLENELSTDSFAIYEGGGYFNNGPDCEGGGIQSIRAYGFPWVVSVTKKGKSTVKGSGGPVRFAIDFFTVDPPDYTCQYSSGKGGLKGTASTVGPLDMTFSGDVKSKTKVLTDCPPAVIEVGRTSAATFGGGTITASVH